MQEMRILLAYFGDWPGYSVINDQFTTMKLKVEEHYFCISAIKLWNSLPVGIRSSSFIKSFTLTISVIVTIIIDGEINLS